MLDYNVEHNHHSPGRLELILSIMLDWETISGNFCFPKLKRTGPNRTIAYNNSQIKLFSHVQVPSSVGECKGEAVSVGERRQTSGTQHVLYYPSA